jgi:hypothetical protein
MNKNRRAEARNFGSKTIDYLSGYQKVFSRYQYMPGQRFAQCNKCGSDYMLASVHRFCQRCLPRGEFILREGEKVEVENNECGGNQ